MRLRVIEAGSSSAPPLILIHGFLVNHLEFDDIIDPLAERSHVLAPDLPGFGQSEKPSPTRYSYGVEAFAEAIADVIAAYELGQVNVLGHCIGGAVAITLAAHYAELITRVVLVDPLCYPFPLSFRNRLTLIPVLGSVYFKQLFGRRSFRSYFHDDVFSRETRVPLERIDRHYDFFNSPSARESAHAVLKSMLDTRPVVARITRIRHPTLVMWGRDDRIFPAACALKLAREINGAKLELFDAGHSPHEERPVDFVAVVQEFLEGRR